MPEMPNPPSLSIDLLQAVDRCCDRFEAAWATGASPACEEQLDGVPEAAQTVAMGELLLVEWQCRIERTDAESALAALRTRESLTETLARHGLDLDVLIAPAPEATENRSGVAPTIRFTPEGRPPGSAGLHLRCPHCQNGVELLADAPLEQIACTSCGSTFGLVGGEESAVAAGRIGRFELIEQIGVGGFGSVWRARDPELDREVAIKIPRRSQLQPQEAELFFREARAAAQLAHPNIVPVHEVGRDTERIAGGVIYIVSELIRGTSLAERLQQKKPTTEQSAQLLATLCDALDYAHQRGVIHRDLKPSNIMLATTTDATDLGTPYLMDFGLAKREVGEITMTMAGQVLGTPAYMSPEQAGGHAQWVDRRTDLYALGVMLFQMLTGELPFRGTAQSQIQQRLDDDAPPARRFAPQVPFDLATICAKCLERDPNRRYTSAAEVAEELRRYLRGEPVQARPIGRIGRVVRWAKRHPALASALALGTVLAVVGPTTAVVIHQQRSALADRLDEITQVVHRDEQKIDLLEREKASLRRTAEKAASRPSLDGWRRKLIARLLDQRGEALGDSFQKLDPKDPQAVTGRIGLGYLYQAADEPAEAIRWLTEAEQLLDVWPVSEGPQLDLRPLHVDCCRSLSRLLSEVGQREEALRMAQRALRVQRVLREESPESIGGLIGVSDVLANRSYLAEDPAAARRVNRALTATLQEGNLPQEILARVKTDPGSLYETACLLTGRREEALQTHAD